MILQLYSIKDRVQGFIPLVPHANEDVALRWYKEMMHENLTMKLSPNDFTLYYMGTYDTETGKIESEVKQIYV